MKGTYKIADKIILIDSVRDGIHKFCREYACGARNRSAFARVAPQKRKKHPKGYLP